MSERRIKPSASSRSLRSAFSFMGYKREERRVVSGPTLRTYPETDSSLSSSQTQSGIDINAEISVEIEKPQNDEDSPIHKTDTIENPAIISRTTSSSATSTTHAKYRARTRGSSIFSLNSIFRDSQSSRSIVSSAGISRPAIHEDPTGVPQDEESAEFSNRIKAHITKDKGLLKDAVSWRQSPKSDWLEGTVWISDGSLCGMCRDSQQTEVMISDLRAVRLNANKQTYAIEITEIHGDERVSLKCEDIEQLLRWISALSVWTCLAGTGIESKRIVPRVVPDTCTGEDPILRCSLQVMGKIVRNKRLSRNIFRPSSATNPQSFHAPTSWITATAFLRPNGILEFTTDDHAFSFSTSLVELTRQDTWNIHWSVFQKHHVLYLGSLRKEDEKVVKLDIFTLSSSTTQKYMRPVDQLTGLYLAFPSHHEHQRWLYVLRNCLRPTYYALASRSFSRTLRSASRIDMRLLQARYKHKSSGHVPPPTSFFELSSRGILLGRSCLGRNSRDPFFRDDFELDSVTDILPLELDCRFINFDDQPLVGRVLITKDLVQGPSVEQWVRIYKPDDPSSSLGDVCIKISHFSSNVLAPHQYEHLEEMLKDTKSGLSAKISEARMSLPEYTEMFVKIYSCLGICDKWLMSLIDGEIGKHAAKGDDPDRAKHISNLLFRGNTLMTKAIEKYMQLTAHTYLRDLIGKVVRQVLDKDERLELDPSRLDEGYGMTEELEALRLRNQERLLVHAETIWTNLQNTISEIPRPLVIVFQYLRNQLEALEQDEEVVFNGISGFLFLRFICPALLAPKLFGLVYNSPQPEVQRTLTLMAKLMQSFANRASFGAKEAFMIPLSSFIENHKQELCEYFRVISDEEKWQKTQRPDYPEPEQQLEQDLPIQPLPDVPRLPYLYDKYACYQELVEHWLTTVPTSRVNGVGSPIIARAIGDKGGLYQITALEFENSTDSFGQDLTALVGSDYTSVESSGVATPSTPSVDPVIEAFHNECLRIYTAKTNLEDELSKAESPLVMEQRDWNHFTERIHVKWDHTLTGHVDAVNPMTIDVGILNANYEHRHMGSSSKRASVQSSMANGSSSKRASVQSTSTSRPISVASSVASMKLLNGRGSLVLEDDRSSSSRGESKIGKWLKRRP